MVLSAMFVQGMEASVQGRVTQAPLLIVERGSKHVYSQQVDPFQIPNSAYNLLRI